MSKHTPDPWIVDHAPRGRVIRGALPDDAPEDSISYRPPVCILLSKQDEGLLLNAPRLLAAAKAALDAMDDSDEFGISDAWGDPEKNAVREKLREAVYDAEGATR